MDRPKLLTLTLKSCDDPLPHQVARIIDRFRRLRADRVWKALVKGGFWVIEITRNKRTGRYHPHIHAVIDAKYLPQTWLADRWEKLTGNSRVVDIRTATGRHGSYLAKYLTKVPVNPGDPSEEWAQYDARYRRRDCNTFGTQLGFIHGDPEPSNLVYVGTLSSLRGRARDGNEWAFDVVDWLWKNHDQFGAGPPRDD